MVSDYEIRTLAQSEELTDEARDWLAHTKIGFVEGRPHEKTFEYWWRSVLRDKQRLRGAYRTDAPSHSWQVPDPIGTLASMDATVNTGGGHLELANFITDVTVRATHRRQGLLRQLLVTDLAEAKDRGLSLATLTATEGGIYRRFGFGVSTSMTSVEIDTSARFQLRTDVESRVELADAQQLTPLREELFAKFHAATTGSHDRLSFHYPWLTGEWNHDTNSANHDLRSAVHFDAEGQTDGVLTYHVKNNAIEVWEFITTNPEAELGLWKFLAGIDLVTTVKYWLFDPQSPLRYALADPRVIKTVRSRDFTWARILDPAKALRVRGFDGRGQLTLRIIDDLGYADGTFHLAVADDYSVEVEPTTAAPDITMQVDTLGEIYHGLASVFALAGARDIEGDAKAIKRLSRMFSTDRVPYNLTSF